MLSTVSYACVLFLIAFSASVHGHTKLTHAVINGQERTECLKPTYPGSLYATTNMGADTPLSSSTFMTEGILSRNYTCGYRPYADQPAKAKCSVAAGSTIGVYYYHGGGYGSEDPVLDKYIARSHKGPFFVYMAKSSTGTGNVWFKIHQIGKIQESTNFNNVKWASPDTLLANNGVFYFKIPSDISPGDYLVRTEIIAMHDSGYHGAQPYVTCLELTVTGSGTANPPGVAIPGSWDYNHPGITYNIYNQFTQAYPFPGPAVYKEGSASTTGSTTGSTTTSKPTTGTSTTGSTTTSKPTTGTTTTGSTTTSKPTTTGYTTGSTTGGKIAVTVKITASVITPSGGFNAQNFATALAAALGIPTNVIANIEININLSNPTTTVVTFTLVGSDNVDPVVLANRLKYMIANNDPALLSNGLEGFTVMNTEEQNNPQDESNVAAAHFYLLALTLLCLALNM